MRKPFRKARRLFVGGDRAVFHAGAAALPRFTVHEDIFAAGQGIPLAGVVYDPKVSAFLRYIGQELFTDLDALTEENLREMIDRAAAQASHPEAQAAAVERLQGMERKNVETARRLLGL